MAGLLEDIGEFFTGGKKKDAERQAERDRKAAEQAAKAGQQLIQQGAGLTQDVYGEAAKFGEQGAGMMKEGRGTFKQGQGFIDSFKRSMGSDAQDYLRLANLAAQQQASQQAQQQAVMGSQQAAQAARASGLNKGQAALAGAQQVGNLYGNAFNQGLQQQLAQYGQAANQFGQMGQQQQQTGLQQQQMGQQAQQFGQAQRAGAAATIGNLGIGQATPAMQAGSQITQAQLGNAGQSAAAGGGFIGGLVSGVGSLLSDERAKDDVKHSSLLELVVGKVKPVTFNYKENSGEDPTKKRVGILAQDLEKTPLKDNVETDENGVKRVNIGQQTLSNTNLISELGQRLINLEKKIGGK